MSEKPFDTSSSKMGGDETLQSGGGVPQEMIGKYPVESKLGQGGMGEVWLGRHPDLDIPVAIKTLPTFLVAKNKGYVDRFIKEARTAARINHANVVRIYDAGIDDDVNFIVMEYVDGGTVKELMNQGGILPPEKALDVTIAIAEALKAAAEFSIIHRDIKPDNIMLDSKGVPKLSDLGLAKQMESVDDLSMTAPGATLGTPNYISPEQVQDSKSVDARADIYSLGATFYHMATGGVPFNAASSFELMLMHVQEPLPPPKQKNPKLADNICAIICKMMEKSPVKRYNTADELLYDLYKVKHANAPVSQLIAGGAEYSGESIISIPGLPEQKKTSPVLAIVAALAIISALCAGGYAVLHGRGGGTAPKPQPNPDPIGGQGTKIPDSDSIIKGETARLTADTAAKQRAHEEAMRLAAEQKAHAEREGQRAAKLRAQAEEAARREAEELAKRIAAEKADAEKKTDAARLALAKAKENARKQTEETKRLLEEAAKAEEATKRAEELAATAAKTAALLKAQREEAERAQAEAEARRLAEMKAKAEEEARLAVIAKKQEEELARLRAAQKARKEAERLAAIAKKQQEEAEAKRIAEEVKRQLAAEAEAKRKADEERLRLAAETAVKRRAEEEKRRLAAEAEAMRKAEEEKRRLAAKAEAKRKAEAAAALAANRLAGEPVRGKGFQVADYNIPMLPIAAGKFTMGSRVTEWGRQREEIQHNVTISRNFWMGKYEITMADYKAVMGALPRGVRRAKDKMPVAPITSTVAMTFCKKLNDKERAAGRLPDGYEYRLPTEAEWEYACRAGGTSAYTGGNTTSALDKYGTYYKRGVSSPAEAGAKKANAWGLHDMHGNVMEWCMDKVDLSRAVIRSDGYGKSATDPISKRGRSQISRGGGWRSKSTDCRSAKRFAFQPTRPLVDQGFRVVLAPILPKQ